MRAAHKYWQMTTSYSPYPAPFSDHKAVGILWSTKVDYATWFGANVEYIHCIQMLPFLPISEELLREEWIQVKIEIDKNHLCIFILFKGGVPSSEGGLFKRISGTI